MSTQGTDASNSSDVNPQCYVGSSKGKGCLIITKGAGKGKTEKETSQPNTPRSQKAIDLAVKLGLDTMVIDPKK